MTGFKRSTNYGRQNPGRLRKLGARGSSRFPERAVVTDMFPDPGDDWQPKLRRLLLDIDARIDFDDFPGRQVGARTL